SIVPPFPYTTLFRSIDFEQHLILGNQRAFPVILFDEIARDLRLDLRIYIPIKRCDPFVVDRDVSLDDLDDLDVWRRSGRCRNVLDRKSTRLNSSHEW